MSQLATARVVDDAIMDELRALGMNLRWEEIHSLLSKSGPDLLRPYRFSGYVFVVLWVFLQKRGVPMPRFDEQRKAIPGLDTQMLLTSTECTELCEAISKMDVTAEDYGKYWTAFNRREWPEAGVAMGEACSLLLGAMRACKQPDQKLFLKIG